MRGLSDRAKAVLKDAREQSATVRQLAERLEVSDVIVYVEVKLLDESVRGTTRLLSATAQARFVVITLNPKCSRMDLLSRLGHELSHAVEISGARDVRDGESMRAFFSRIGWQSRGPDQWETGEAIEVGRRVTRELWERPALLVGLAEPR